MGFLAGLKALSAIAGAARQFFAWLNAQMMRRLGAAEQANKAAVEAEQRGNEGDDIDRRIEGATDAELDRLEAELRGDK